MNINVNGTQEAFKNYKIRGVEDGEYTDAPTYNEIYEQWFYKRSGLKVKDFEFSLSLLQDAYERGTPIGDLVKERIQAIGEWLN